MQTWMWFVVLFSAAFVFFAAGYLVGMSRVPEQPEDFTRRPIEHPEDTDAGHKFASRPHPASEAHVSQVRSHWK